MKVVCIGSGNVATHFTQALNAAGHSIVQIWSKGLKNAKILGNSLQAPAISNWEELNQDADLYLIAVRDDAIAGVAEQLQDIQGLVLHTSGATALTALSLLKRSGVLYPLQTFSKAKAVDFKLVPLCIEASKPADLSMLRDLATQLSSKVYDVDSKQRKILHLAAVFACNFTNHLYHISSSILEENQLDFAMLHPLIQETVDKIQTETPFNAQTGPALRNDQVTMDAHINLLKSSPEFKEIYINLSDSIKKTHK
jgi:predicted short-subunit dehydrogenase-like oxidoreductase (DUF2520 family)